MSTSTSIWTPTSHGGQVSLTEEDSPQRTTLGAVLTASGQPAECLCSFLVKQEKQRVEELERATAGKGNPEDKGGVNPPATWSEMQLHATGTLGIICSVSNQALQTVVESGVVAYLLGLVRYVSR